MTKQQTIAFNEKLALEKIRAAFRAGDLREAEHIARLTMGITATAAYNKVMGICFDLTEVGK